MKHALTSFHSFIFIALIITILTLSGCGGAYYKGSISDHFDGEKFYNPDIPAPEGRNFFTFLKWRLFGDDRAEWPDQIIISEFDTPPNRVYGGELRVSYVGHATLLIQTQGLNILTDPMWSDRASPVSFAGPKRIKVPGIHYEKLPPIDIILISHNHYDHMDIKTLSKLWQDHHPRIIVPLGNDLILKNAIDGIAVESYDWKDQTQLSADVLLHLIPVQHWSARGIWDRNDALWTGYMIQTPNGSIFFSGDLGYGDGKPYQNLAKEFPDIRFAALAIGAYKPEWFMKYSHMSPEEAVKLYQMIGAKHGLGIHHGVFPLGGDSPYDATNDLLKATQEQKINSFKTIEVGQNWNIP